MNCITRNCPNCSFEVLWARAMADFRLDVDYKNHSKLEKENIHDSNEKNIIDQKGKKDGLENINIMNITADNLGNLSLDDIARGSPVTKLSSGPKDKNMSVIELLDDSDCSYESSLANQKGQNIINSMVDQNISILSVHSENDGDNCSIHNTRGTSQCKTKNFSLRQVKATSCLDAALNHDDDDFSSSSHHSIDSSIASQKRDDSILTTNINSSFAIMNNPSTVLSDTEPSEKTSMTSHMNFPNENKNISKDRNKRKYNCEKMEHIIDLCDSPAT